LRCCEIRKVSSRRERRRRKEQKKRESRETKKKEIVRGEDNADNRGIEGFFL